MDTILWTTGDTDSGTLVVIVDIVVTVVVVNQIANGRTIEMAGRTGLFHNLFRNINFANII